MERNSKLNRFLIRIHARTESSQLSGTFNTVPFKAANLWISQEYLEVLYCLSNRDVLSILHSNK